MDDCSEMDAALRVVEKLLGAAAVVARIGMVRGISVVSKGCCVLGQLAWLEAFEADDRLQAGSILQADCDDGVWGRGEVGSRKGLAIAEVADARDSIGDVQLASVVCDFSGITMIDYQSPERW